MITRRSLFGLLPALGAVVTPLKESSDHVEPIIFEHTCDHAWNRRSPEEQRDMEREYGLYAIAFKGCGTTFQWHFGVPPYCPKCGYAYEMTMAVLQSGAYRVVQGRLPK